MRSGGLVSAGVSDLIESALDELFALLTNVVIDGGHRLDGAGGRAGEGEFAVGHLALVQRERAVTQDDETAVREMAGFVFVEIKYDFFVGKGILADFHGCFRVDFSVGDNPRDSLNLRTKIQNRAVDLCNTLKNPVQGRRLSN
jgi:hypothetical protein